MNEVATAIQAERRGMAEADAAVRDDGWETGRRRVTLLTSGSGARVAGMLPDVDNVIIYDAPWLKGTAMRSDASVDTELIHVLEARRFDAAVIFTTFSQSPLPAAMLCFLAGIPLRLAHCHENPYQLLTDHIPDPEPEQFIRHEVQRQLDLVSHIGCSTGDERMSLVPPAHATTRVKARLAVAIDLSRPWLLIHPGSTASSRRYSLEGFAGAAGTLVREHGYQIVFSGDASECSLVEAIQARIAAPSTSLAGRTSVEEMAALIALAPVLISNNTGPVHMAAALQTPVVDLYAMTNPQHTPWLVPSRVLMNPVPCGYCYKSVCPAGHHACLEGIPPAQVVEATLSLLRETVPSEVPLAGV